MSEVELGDWSEGVLNNYLQYSFVPINLSLQPILFVFVNNGSKGGAITDIILRFEPNSQFKRFYQHCYPTFQTGSNAPQMGSEALPVVVKEGDTCIVKLSLNITVIQWQQYFRHGEITDVSNLKKAFRESIEIDKRLFQEYVSFMKSKKPLGKLRVTMVYLGRRWFRTRKKTKEIANTEIKNNCNILLDGLEKILEKWDSNSAVNTLLASVTNRLEEVIQRLNENLEKVRVEFKDGKNLGTLNDLSDWQRQYVSSRMVERIIFEREKSLKTDIDELSQEIKDYNHKLSVTSMAKGDVSTTQIDSLNEERERMKSKIIQTLSKIVDLRRRVIDEIET